MVRHQALDLERRGMQAVDYSFARPDPAEIAARGYVGALRYLAPLPNRKVIDAAEIGALHAAGLAIGFVWESTALRPRQGYSAGVRDAQSANGLADNLGVPDHVTIYYAVDYDADPDEITGYFEGAGSINRRPVGGYGSYRVIESLLDRGLISHAWQTTAWSRGNRSNRAHLFQRVGVDIPDTDINDVLQDDWGQWSPSSPIPPASAPALTQQEDIMLVEHKDRTYLLHAGVLVHITDVPDLPKGAPVPVIKASEPTWKNLTAKFAVSEK